MKTYFFTIIFLVLFFCVQGQRKSNTVFDNVDYTIEPIESINTVASDISPFFVGDHLYFSSVREEYFNKGNRERKSKAFYDLYGASLNDQGLLTSDRTLVSGFGADYHEGPAAYCEKTGEMFITLSNVIHPDTIRKLFSVENVSLRLAIMKKNDHGVWKIKEELPFNDDRFHFAHPAISKAGDTLVFASDIDSLTIGKIDLFMSVRKDGIWSDPVNLGKLVNTTGNEMYPTFIEGGLLSFASDGRVGGYGGLDIYYTSFPQISDVINLGDKINTHFDEFGLVLYPGQDVGYFSSNRGNVGSDDIFRLDIKRNKTEFNGLVLDDRTGEPIDNAKVDLYGCSNEILQTLYSDESGKFRIEVLESDCPVVKASKEGYENDIKDVSHINYVELRLKQIFKREILVVDVDNNNPLTGAEVRCENEVVFQTDDKGVVYLNPPFPYDCELMVTSKGYLDQTLILDSTNIVNGFARDTVRMYKRELNKTFVLDNIYYDFDKWDILPESEIELNKLIKIMNDNPDLKVEFGSHTDSRGSDEYNKRLSQKRSDSAVGYIIKKGISKDRIVAKGYGETQLLNRCANGVSCSEEEHRQNRRTVFKIIGFGGD